MAQMIRWLARVAIAQSRTIKRKVEVPAAKILARVEPTKRPLSATPGKASLGPRVVVFCHFHPYGRLQEHVRRYIVALVEAGLSVVFVTNSGCLDPEAADWLYPRCTWVVIRRNTGFDFAAWRDGLAIAGLPAAAETELLIIANDSVYGPLSPLGPLLARMDFGVADVWGLTDSWQLRFHLQSYLVAFGPRALNHPVFARFWKRVRDFRSKEAVVHAYEIGLTQVLLDAGLTCEVLWPYVDTLTQLHGAQQEAVDTSPLGEVRQQAERRVLAAAARRVPLNPTAELWRPLLVSGFPFLKRELLRKNPAFVPDVAGWLDLARTISPDEAEVILRDLRNSLRKSAP
jgi:hypothetical protein